MLKNDNPQDLQDQSSPKADEKTQDDILKNDISEETDVSGAGEQPESIENTTEDSVANDNNEAEETQPQQEADPKEMMIKELEEKNKELNDKYLRLFSEFDNFRKRNLKERIELTKTASAEMTEAVLPVLDDLERAYKSAIENPDIEALTEGVNLICAKLKTTLKHKGLEAIPTIGEEFNTDFHEAITHIPAKEDKEKGKVVDEVQKGYTLNGKVLRFAKVVVAN